MRNKISILIPTRNRFTNIVRLIKSIKDTSEFFNTSIALKVMSLRFPIGVETIYKLLEDIFII